MTEQKQNPDQTEYVEFQCDKESCNTKFKVEKKDFEAFSGTGHTKCPMCGEDL